ncbi:hypothetical protein ZOSMA_54G00140 [Zostera marina]|uniref:Uncharacterized protein n=1 Tax=Zostera marina TaxID=29655 RepID=A0A0K9NYQ8_ZOSMR|nr:hypothetical protein ZOSMA_54G00140 [Zostera marina]
MDSSHFPQSPRLSVSAPVEQDADDEWDTDGFVIPSLTVGDLNYADSDIKVVDKEDTISPPLLEERKEEEIYLGPHGAPHSQSKQHQDLNSSYKKRFKNKLKEADWRHSGHSRENKVETLRELVGGSGGDKVSSSRTMQQKSSSGWLDQHCNEWQFEKHPH